MLLAVALLMGPASQGPVAGWPVAPDLHTYRAAGAAWLDGTDPYDLEVLQDHAVGPLGGHWVYPAWALPLVAPLAFLPAPALAPLAAVGGGLALALLALLAWRRADADHPLAAALATSGALLFLVPGLHDAVRQGNAATVQALLAAAAFLALDGGRGRSAGVLLGLAGGLKGFPWLLALAWLPAREARRPALVALGATIVALGLAHVALASDPLAFLTPLQRNLHVGPVDQSLRSLLDATGRSRLWLVPAGVGLVAGTAWRARRPGSWEPALWLAVLLAMPRLMSYEAMLALPPVAAVLARTPTAAIVVIPAGIACLLGDDYGVLGVIATAWTADLALSARAPVRPPPT